MKNFLQINGEQFEVGTKDINQEMKFVETKGFAPASIYQHSFGPINHKTTYMNGWTGVDYRPALKDAMDLGYQRIHGKALGPESGGAGTAGYALVPVYVDPRIVDRVVNILHLLK